MSKRRRARERVQADNPDRGRRPDGIDAERARKPSRSVAGKRSQISPVLLASGAVLVLGLVAAGALAWSGVWGRQTTPSIPGVGERPAARIDATGRLLVPLEGGLALVGLPDRSVREVVKAGRSASVTAARWAPDGNSAAYAYYHVRLGDAAASSEIFLTDLVGEPRVVVERDRPGAAVEAPAWAPDGRALYFGYSALENQRVVQRIERLELASGARTVVTEGSSPAVSPDGALLAHLRAGREGESLILSQPDGRDPRTLVGPGRYSALGAARFAPDGRTLALPVSGGAGQAQEPAPARPFGLVGAGVAFAHGDPWDVALIDLQGGEPRRLTRILEDEIGITWSPDGAQLAVFGSRGLYLVERDGRTSYAMDRGGYGGIDWAR